MAYEKQTWVNGASGNTPLSADRLNHIEEGIFDTSLSSGQLLWTNPNVNVEFNEQDVNLNGTDFDMIEIFYYDYTGRKGMMSQKIKVGEKCTLTAVFEYGNGGYVGSRHVSQTSNQTVHFGGAVSIIQTDRFGRQAVNDWCVPVFIVGYKTNLFN